MKKKIAWLQYMDTTNYCPFWWHPDDKPPSFGLLLTPSQAVELSDIRKLLKTMMSTDEAIHWMEHTQEFDALPHQLVLRGDGQKVIDHLTRKILEDV